jgi:hypothetical protein
MTQIHNEISTPSQIKKLGFVYADKEAGCTLHFINNVQVPMDMTWFPEVTLEEVEKKLDNIFYKILVTELRESGVKKLRKIEWERWYLMKNFKTARKFTAFFNVRILGFDPEPQNNKHTILR